MIICSSSRARVLALIAAPVLLLRLGGGPDAMAQTLPVSADASGRTISLTVSTGDTLDGMLAGQGLDPALRAEASLAITAEFEPERLQPGDLLELRWRDRSESVPEQIALTIENGIRIEVVLGEAVLIGVSIQLSKRSKRPP